METKLKGAVFIFLVFLFLSPCFPAKAAPGVITDNHPQTQQASDVTQSTVPDTVSVLPETPVLANAGVISGAPVSENTQDSPLPASIFQSYHPCFI